jgi:uncharacterized membrane protein
MSNSPETIVIAAAIGGLSGMRSMLPAAILARSLRKNGKERGPASAGLAGTGAAILLPLFAIGEIVADKSPMVPARTGIGPLIGRIGMAKLCAVAIAERRREGIILPAAVAGGAAIIGAFAAYHVRRALTSGAGIPDPVVAVAEDAIVFASATAVVDMALSD